MSALLDALQRHAESKPLSIALKSTNGDIRYGELLECASRVAASIEALNIRRLGLLADNGIQWIVIDIAARIAGIVLVPLPTFFSAEQLQHIIAAADLDALLAERTANRQPIADFLHDGQHLFGLHLARREFSGRALPENTAKITFTSGSSGTPKGVLLTASVMDGVAIALAAALQDIPMKNHLCVLPLSTLLENIAGVYVPLHRGTTLTVLPPADVGLNGSSRFDAVAMLQAARNHDADSLILTPQLLKAVVNVVQQGKSPSPDLAFVAVGGGRVATGLLRDARALGLPVYEGYGLSECSSVVSLNTPAFNGDGSAGKPLAHVEVKILDGEIYVGGSTSTYLDSTTPAPQYIATGDLGHVDNDGFLFITGRKKNILITSYGRNVSPEWIESELLETSAIAQCMVFGDDRPSLGALIFSPTEVSDEAITLAIKNTNKHLPDYARINVWQRLSTPFSIANGLLTENLRIKRDAIFKQFQNDIAALYSLSDFSDNDTSFAR